MGTILPLFWNLSSSSKNERIGASVKLINALEGLQKQFTSANASSTSDDEQDPAVDSLDALNAQDVSYSIRRLVRGLASPRESSRLGFSVALTELLCRLETVTCSQVVSLILDSSKSQGSTTGQEERDLLFARLFGLTAVIQSGLFVRTSALSTSASNSAIASTPESSITVISQLVEVGEKKSWLRESAWWSISLGIDALQHSDAEWKGEVFDFIVKFIFEDNKSWFPEKVAVALKLQALQPQRDWKTLVAPTFKKADLLMSNNLLTLSKILKESSLDEEQDDVPKSAAGVWKPQVHFVWDIILDRFFPSVEVAQKPTTASFEEFFRVVVDESLFSSTASLEKKYWGLQIFLKALPCVTPANMPMLFNPNFMRCWINHLAQKDRYLHQVALQVASKIKTYVDENPAMGFTLITQLTGVNGSHQFDKLTKTKTVESILAAMDADGVKDYVNLLLQQFAETQHADEQAVNSRRSYIIDQLGSLIRTGAIPRADGWIQLILDWLVVHGLFTIKKKSEKSSYRAIQEGPPKPVLADVLRTKCRTVLVACLMDLTNQMTVLKQDHKTSKAAGVASDGAFWTSKVLETVADLEQDTRHVAFLNPMNDDDKNLRAEARDLCSKLEQQVEQQSEAKGAKLLLQSTILWRLCHDEQEDELEGDSLQSCMEAAKRMFLAPKNSKKSRKSNPESEDPSQLPPIDIFIDYIIAFFEKSSSYMRAVGTQAFAMLSGVVQETTIDLILAQLEPRDISESLDDEKMDEDQEEEEEEEEEEDSDDQSEEGQEEDSNDEDADLELRQKIEEALRINGVEAARESDEESEELMDDDQMMAIDEQLAAVFRSQSSKKAGKDIGAQREATHFKNRVLDLVDIFMKRQTTSPLLVRFIMPLVDLVSHTNTDERQLQNKTEGLLRSRIGKAKDLPDVVDIDQVSNILIELHSRSRKARNAEILSTLGQCSIFVSKILAHAKQEKIVCDAYRMTLSDFVTRKNSSMNPAFFQDWIQRQPAVAWELRNDILSLSSKAANLYRRCQCFHFLQILVSQLPAIDTPQKAVTEFMASLSEALTQAINEACDVELAFNTAQLKELLKLGITAVRQTNRITQDTATTSTVWKLHIWQLNQQRLEQSDRFKASSALKNLCSQICQAQQSKKLSKINGEQKKVDPSVGETSSTDIKPAKRKHVNHDHDKSSTIKKAKKAKHATS